MPRKGHIAKRDVLPDPMYDSKLVINSSTSCSVGKRQLKTFIQYI